MDAGICRAAVTGYLQNQSENTVAAHQNILKTVFFIRESVLQMGLLAYDKQFDKRLHLFDASVLLCNR